MCIEIFNEDTGETIDSVQGLAKMLGTDTDEIPADALYARIAPEGCLCQVDIQETCRLFDLECILRDSGFDVSVRRKKTVK